MTNMERKKIDKKEQINDAAVKIIAQKGYHEATMQDIAHEAGLAVGTLYNYFNNKADLIISIFHDKWEELQKGINETTQDIQDFQDLQRTRFKYIINFFNKNPDYIRILFAQVTNFIVTEQDLRERIVEIIDLFTADVVKHLEMGRELGYYQFRGNAKTIASAILGIFHSFLVDSTIASKEIEEEDVNTIFNFIQNGLTQNKISKRIQLEE